MNALQTNTRSLAILCQLFSSRMTTLLEPHGITPAQFGILNHIARPDMREGTRIADIAAAVEVHQPAVTKTVAKFEALGLVRLVASPTDQRAKLIYLTQKGGEQLIEIQKGVGAGIAGLFENISESELQQFAQTSGKLSRWLDANRL